MTDGWINPEEQLPPVEEEVWVLTAGNYVSLAHQDRRGNWWCQCGEVMLSGLHGYGRRVLGWQQVIRPIAPGEEAVPSCT